MTIYIFKKRVFWFKVLIISTLVISFYLYVCSMIHSYHCSPRNMNR